MVEDDHLDRCDFLRAILCIGDLCLRKREGVDSHPGDFLFRNDVYGCIRYPRGGNRRPAFDLSFAACGGIESSLAFATNISYTPLAKRTSLYTNFGTNFSSIAGCRTNVSWLILMADKVDFSARYGSWAIVAGASEGLGAAYAGELASRGLNLILVARRSELLQALASHLSKKYNVEIKTIVADLSALDAAKQILRDTNELEIGLLVYNAAFSAIGPFLERSLDD